jgi:radical SAM-linked protein
MSALETAVKTSSTARSTKYRLRFAKSGDLRLLSHHDLMRALERMLRRGALPVAQSQGFNPRPKVTFALALGLGIEGLREVVDIELTDSIEPAELLERLRAVAPPGFLWHECEALAPGTPAPNPRTVDYCVAILPDRRRAVISCLETLLASAQWPMTRHRPDRLVNFDLRSQLVEAEMTTEGLLRFRLKVSPEGSARPEELLEALGARDLLAAGAVLSRTNMNFD